MKKFVMMGLCAASLAPAANADMIGIYAGAGAWQADFTGEVGENGRTISVDDLNLDEVNSKMIWVNLEHPIPVIPNLRLMHTQIRDEAMSTTTQDFQIGGVGLSADVDVLTEMDVSHTDATLYYELLDNWVTLDLGLTARYFDGYVDVQSELTEPARSDLNGVLPMVYVNAQFEVPFANLTFGVSGNAISYDGDGVVDLTAKVGYFFEFGPVVDLGANIGYRRMQLTAKNVGELYADITANGPFAEVYLHF